MVLGYSNPRLFYDKIFGVFREIYMHEYQTEEMIDQCGNEYKHSHHEGCFFVMNSDYMNRRHLFISHLPEEKIIRLIKLKAFL